MGLEKINQIIVVGELSALLLLLGLLARPSTREVYPLPDFYCCYLCKKNVSTLRFCPYQSPFPLKWDSFMTRLSFWPHLQTKQKNATLRCSNKRQEKTRGYRKRKKGEEEFSVCIIFEWPEREGTIQKPHPSLFHPPSPSDSTGKPVESRETTRRLSKGNYKKPCE